MLTRAITVNQTLHGYDEGHRLLATSLKLSTAAERLLLEMSDLSGDGIVNGFEEYLTGYPLPEDDHNRFALAKTWYAREMERPGCVWTHTLIVEIEELTRLHQPKELLSNFVRPHKGQAFTSYETKLNVHAEDALIPTAHVEPRLTGQRTEELVGNLFYSIYQNKKSAVLLTGNAIAFETLILQMWWQQWPALRGTFSFCTGALSPRMLPSGKLFAAQVAPEQNYYLFAKHRDSKARNSADLIDGSKPSPSQLKPWYEVALSNLRSGQYPNYVKFLREFGPTLSPSRTSFSRLTQLFWLMSRSLNETKSLGELTSVLKQRFPKSTDAGELKLALYGDGRAWCFLSDKSNPTLEDALLSELIETKHADMFDVPKLELAERVCRLWERNHDLALSLMTKCFETGLLELNPIRQEFLSASISSASSEEIIALTQTRTNLLETAIALNPGIAESPSLWQLDENRQRYLFGRLQSLETAFDPEALSISVQWERVAIAMLDAGSDLFAQSLSHVLGDRLPELILTWHAKSGTVRNPVLGSNWLEVLGGYPQQVMTWLKTHRSHENNTTPIPTCALIATVLDPNSYEVRASGTEVWLDLAHSCAETIAIKDRNPVLSFLLAVGLSHEDATASKLVVCAFEPIYDAASLDALPWRSWSQLEHLAPSYGLIWSWDKCHRLEEALITKVAKCNWPAEILLKAGRSSQVIRQIIQRAKDSTKGRRLLAELRERVRHNSIPLDPTTRALLGV